MLRHINRVLIYNRISKCRNLLATIKFYCETQSKMRIKFRTRIPNSVSGNLFDVLRHVSSFNIFSGNFKM